jgi:uncharacterized membrane protein
MSLDSAPRPSLAHRAGKYVLLGVLTVAPLWVTWLVFDFVLGLLRRFGAPVVDTALAVVAPHVMVTWAANPVLRSAAAVLFTLLALWLVGLAASRVVGRRLIEAAEALLERIPIVQAVYGGTKRFITAMWRPPGRGQRVVLINFPSPHLKTVGFVTGTMREDGTGRELAAVYVPTAPNPTSGYIQIVPLDEVVYIDWTVEQVMSFVVTGGANTPAGIRLQVAERDPAGERSYSSSGA